jgi:hypothetical protein
MEPRKADGGFLSGFNPDQYTEDICESNGWQYFWNAPQSVDSLIALVGGKERFTDWRGEATPFARFGEIPTLILLLLASFLGMILLFFRSKASKSLE